MGFDLRGLLFMKNSPETVDSEGSTHAWTTTRAPFSAEWNNGIFFISFGTAAATPVRLSPNPVRLGPGLTALAVTCVRSRRRASS